MHTPLIGEAVKLSCVQVNNMHYHQLDEQSLAHIASGAEQLPQRFRGASGGPKPTDPRGCTLCPLGDKTLGSHPWFHPPKPSRIVVVAGYHTTVPPGAGASTTHFPPEAEVLERLLQKLGVAEECHRTFAIKCPAPRGIPPTSLRSCNLFLTYELEQANPHFILAFGTHAWSAVQKALGLEGDFQRCFEEPIQKIRGGGPTVIYLPGALELTHTPQWRGHVWSTLQNVSGLLAPPLATQDPRAIP